MRKEEKPTLSRRDALKTIAAATGATALATLPGKWETPIIEGGMLPAHAQASGPTAIEYPFTSIVEVGLPGSGVFPEEDRGWIAVTVNNGVVVSNLSSADGVTAQQLPAVIPPILPNVRNFSAPAPSWTSVSIVKTSFTFISQTNVIPEDDTELMCYGISGDQQFEAVITARVVSGVVIFDFPLPSTYSGIFYFSVNFVRTTITLTNSVTIDIQRYFAAAIYAEFTIYAEVPPSPPFLTGGIVEVVSANDCPLPGSPLPGSQLGVTVNHTGGNVTAGSKLNNFMLFFPSGSISQFDTPNVIITPTTMFSSDICIVFNTDTLVYYSVWITDADGRNSNSIGNFFIPVNLNDTGTNKIMVGPVSKE